MPSSLLVPTLDRSHFRDCDWLHAEDPEVCELLEQLDDAIFQAIDGCENSLNETQQLWRIASVVLGTTLLEESRDQYVRRAVEVIDNITKPNSRQEAADALAALHILRLLADESAPKPTPTPP